MSESLNTVQEGISVHRLPLAVSVALYPGLIVNVSQRLRSGLLHLRFSTVILYAILIYPMRD